MRIDPFLPRVGFEVVSVSAAEELHILKHATAWDDPMACRNYFWAVPGTADDRTCAELASMGLMRLYRQGDGLNGYDVTSAGYDALRLVAPSKWPEGTRAWSCEVRGIDEGECIVFAVTRGKAHAATHRAANDAGFDVPWADIKTRRAPVYDESVYLRNGRREALRCYRPSDLTEGAN